MTSNFKITRTVPQTVEEVEAFGKAAPERIVHDLHMTYKNFKGQRIVVFMKGDMTTPLNDEHAVVKE